MLGRMLVVVGLVLTALAPATVDAQEAEDPAIARGVALFEEEGIVALRVVYDAGPGDPDYDLVAVEYGEDWDEWEAIWREHQPEHVAALDAVLTAQDQPSSGTSSAAAGLLALGALVAGLLVGGLVGRRLGRDTGVAADAR